MEQGCTVFLTGLSGSGKSTVAAALVSRLRERGRERVTLLDGDAVRRDLSPELGFSRDHRGANIRRIGSLARDVTLDGGIAICAAIAPYDDVRREVRQLVETAGPFVLVYLSTPLAICEARDPKGLYARARAGLIKDFTGVSDPYEPPTDADIVIDTTGTSPENAVATILSHLAGARYAPQVD